MDQVYYQGDRVTHRIHGDGKVFNHSEKEFDPGVVTIDFDEQPAGWDKILTVSKRLVEKLPVEARE